MLNNVLIVCIGNICRSPMAEALLAKRLVSKGPKITVHSAGIHALSGWKADPTAQLLMQEKGLDISSHIARQLTKEMLFDSDLILTMDQEQNHELEQLLPSIRGRVHCLGKWGTFNTIPDPYQKPREAFEESLILIEQGIDDWCQKLWK